MRCRFALVLTGVALLAAVLPAAAESPSVGPVGTQTGPADGVVDEVVVLFEPDSAEAARADALAAHAPGAAAVRTVTDRAVTLTVDPGHLDAVVAALSADPIVAAASPNEPVSLATPVELAASSVELAATSDGSAASPVGLATTSVELAPPPNDLLFGEQWGLENTGQVLYLDGSSSTPGVDVHARAAWAVTTGSPQVVVAVLDSGIDITHPDLATAVWTNPGEQPDGTDTDGNGVVDDVNGYDAIGQVGIDGSRADGSVAELHGTAVAGVIAARSGDAFGIAGMAPQVRLMPIRAFAQDLGGAGAGSSDVDTLLRAIDYAVSNGANLINASWEAPFQSSVLERAIADAGVPVVAAAGNSGEDLDGPRLAIPASFELPNLVAVTAIDPRGELPAFANYGARAVELAAPGTSIATTVPGGGHVGLFDGVNGTSFSAPYVSGALALGLSVYPTTSIPDLMDALLRTTTAQPSLQGRISTGGSLDAGAFLHALEQPVCGDPTLPAAGFDDVAVTSTHARAIDCIAAAGVTDGYADGTYRPATTVTRGQLASFLVGIIEAAGVVADELPDAPTDDAFADDDGTTHEASINVLAALGVLQGDELGRVRPNEPVTRGQLATLLVRTYAVLDDTARTPSRTWFPDTVGGTHELTIGVARDLGLVRGRDRVTYDAGSVTRRDQMASTLARMLDSLAREGVAVPDVGD